MLTDTDMAALIVEAGDEYRAAAHDPLAIVPWTQLSTEVAALWATYVWGIYHVSHVQSDESYPDAESMFADIENRNIAVSDTSHPDYWTPAQNRRFRAVHDILGHFPARLGFNVDDEIRAYVEQSRHHSPSARRALFVEVIGQSAACFLNGGRFPEQKIYASNVYERWANRLHEGA